MSDLKKDNFLRLAKKRGMSVLKRIQLLGNLGNRNVYSYTDIQVEKLFSTLRLTVDKAQSKFHSGDDENVQLEL